MREYNEQVFTPDEVEKGLHLDLIRYLIDYNTKSGDSYNDIHLTTDGYCTIVNWILKSFEHDEGEGFVFKDSDEEIMKRVLFPDNHIEYLLKDEVEETLNEWLKENPGYKKNEYGNWYREEDLVNLSDLQMEQNENSL